MTHQALFPDWQALASCAALPLSDVERLFFGQGPATKEARDLCAKCPVRRECRASADVLEVGTRANVEHMAGIWAGETPRQRARRRRADR